MGESQSLLVDRIDLGHHWLRGARRYLLPQLVAWATTRAVWSASDGALCRQHQDGACWAFVIAKWDYLRFGSYPVAERWRVDVVGGDRRRSDRLAAVDERAPAGLGRVLVFCRLSDSDAHSPARFVLAWSADCRYAALGRHFRFAADGGRRHRLLFAARRASCAWTPFAVAGRPAASIVFIEFVRGVPFITVLFMANNLLPLFVPEAWTPDRLLRPLAGIAIFSAAYMAEEVRGGLQSFGEGTIRRRDGARTELSADDGPRHTAPGADPGDTGHRQQFRWPVHGHDARFDRWRDRFSRSDEQCDQRSGLDRADDHGDGLCLRRRSSISSSASE